MGDLPLTYKRAYERKDKQTKEWLEVEYPKIKKQAKKDNADIWWCDETHCQSLPTNLKGYAKKGTKPVLSHPAKKFLVKRSGFEAMTLCEKINMISAITNTGKTMFSLYE